MHLSPDVLALLALGETPDEPVDRAHLESCAQCRTELDELSRAVRVGRSVTEEDMLITPADRVWHGIRAELGLDENATSAEVVSLADRRVGNAAAPPRTVRRWLVPLLAAALALVVGVGLGIGLDRTSGQRETVIAEAELDALPEWAGAAGTATVEQDSDGRRWLVVDVEAPAPNGAEPGLAHRQRRRRDELPRVPHRRPCSTAHPRLHRPCSVPRGRRVRRAGQ